MLESIQFGHVKGCVEQKSKVGVVSGQLSPADAANRTGKHDEGTIDVGKGARETRPCTVLWLFDKWQSLFFFGDSLGARSFSADEQTRQAPRTTVTTTEQASKMDKMTQSLVN